MNSKKALELAILEYEKDLEYEETNQWVENVLKGLKDLKQDLEKLEKENQELRKSIKSWNENAGNLLKENTKLKKVIEVLIDNLQPVLKEDIDPLINRKIYSVEISKQYKLYTGFETTQENYELIKEVLENE